VAQALDEIKIGGLGSSRKRVEDDRFLRGKGNYTDDFKLLGMVHMEILRSPLAHARIKSIDTSKAWQIPGVDHDGTMYYFCCAGCLKVFEGDLAASAGSGTNDESSQRA
jgi:Aldehyde oxidase and xanthine dehydrogenase, a/b hammerhead domain